MGLVLLAHLEVHLRQLRPEIGLRKRSHGLRPLRAQNGMDLGQYLQLLDTLPQLPCPPLLLVLLADLLDLRSVHIIGLGRPMYIEYVRGVEDGVEVLEEGVVDDLEPDAEVIAECVENAAALHLGRIGGDLIVIVSINLSVYVIFVQHLSLLALDEQKVQEVHETLLELLDQLPAHQLLLAQHLVEGLEEVALAGPRDHLGLKDLLVEVQVHLLGQRTDVSYVDTVFVQKVLYALAVHQEDSSIVQHLGEVGDVILLHSLTGVCQFQLALGVGLLTHLTEDHVGEGRLGADDHLRPEVPDRLDDVAVDEERPQLGHVHEVEIGLRQFDGLVLRKEDGIAVDEFEESLMRKLQGEGERNKH